MAWLTTEQADEDLARLAEDGTVQFGLRRTLAYLADLRTAFELLAAHPRMARERDGLPPHARLHPFRAHNIIYSIKGDDILILRVLGHRQDWQHLD
jgi:toxin ParE1/3/4